MISQKDSPFNNALAVIMNFKVPPEYKLFGLMFSSLVISSFSFTPDFDFSISNEATSLASKLTIVNTSLFSIALADTNLDDVPLQQGSILIKNSASSSDIDIATSGAR